MISVIIPTYNAEDTIKRTIQSVLDQTFHDFELIIVDDASIDSTEEIVRNISDQRIKFIKHSKNSGAPAKTKNTGIENAQGEYIAFLDHDDEWLPEKLEKQVKIFKNNPNNIGIVACNVLDVYETGGSQQYRIEEALKEKDPSVRILERCFIHSSSSVMVKADVLADVGRFDEDLNISDDWDLWIRILNNYNFDHTCDFLLRYYVHDSNLSTKFSEKKPEDLKRILRKNKDFYENHKEEHAEMLRYTGNLYLMTGKKKTGRHYLRESLSMHKKIQNRLNYLLSFLPSSLYRKIIYFKRVLS